MSEHDGFDIGVVKTTPFTTKTSMFELSYERQKWWGMADLMGAGKIDIANGVYGRSQGTSPYFRMGSDIYIVGHSKKNEHPGRGVSIAPNDSGGPILDSLTGKVIAVASRTTVTSTSETSIPAVSIGTFLGSEENHSFLLKIISGNFRETCCE